MQNAVRVCTLIACMLVATGIASATPSSIILIPSTDTVDKGTVHVDLDTLFTVGQGSDNSSVLSIGATCGVADRLEVGFDYLSDTTNPLVANVKYQVCGNDTLAFAVGGWLLGDQGSSGANQVYGLVSYTCEAGRFAAGFATGSQSTLEMDEDQLWLSYDRSIGDDWWVGADFVSGDSFLGSLNAGVGYSFAENAGIIVGYNAYNSSGAFDDTVTVQIDIDL